MTDDKLYYTIKEGKDVLDYIFRDSSELYHKIAPNGWVNSEYIQFLHPTPSQKYEEYLRISDNINKFLKKKDREEKMPANANEFKQDELVDIPELEEFLYVLGLAVYDIFSNNHDVVGPDARIYDLGSFRGSGRFIADYFNEKFDILSKKYDYLDFYMGTIWIEPRGDLLPFYEFVFNKLKELNCDWNYFFPRLFLIDPKKAFETTKDDEFKNYDPGREIIKEMESEEEHKEVEKFREELNNAHFEEYEDAKYKPLPVIIKAYRNVYGILPNGHPQKEFE